MSESSAVPRGATRYLLCALPLAIGAAACGESQVEPDEEPLTAQEAEALFVAANTITVDSTTLISGTDDEFRCPKGGKTKVLARNVDSDEQNNRITMDWTTAPEGCKNSSGNLTFTVDGNPSTKTDIVFNLLVTKGCPDGSDFCTTVESTYSGNLKWQLEERSGECAIDVKMEAYVDGSNPEDPKMEGTAKGSACGHQIEVPASKLVLIS